MEDGLLFDQTTDAVRVAPPAWNAKYDASIAPGLFGRKLAQFIAAHFIQKNGGLAPLLHPLALLLGRGCEFHNLNLHRFPAQVRHKRSRFLSPAAPHPVNKSRNGCRPISKEFF